MLTKHAKNIPGQFKKIAHKLSDWFKCMHFTSADRLISLLQTTKLCGHLKRVVTIFCVSFSGCPWKQSGNEEGFLLLAKGRQTLSHAEKNKKGSLILAKWWC